MDKTQKRPLVSGLRVLIGTLSVLGVVLIVASWGGIAGLGSKDTPLPQQSPKVVVEKFYEYISEAKIRGGSMLIREAYKLTTGKQTRYGQAKFLEVINRYPAGFNATIIDSNIQDGIARVTIEQEMGSSFGSSYKVKSVIPLLVDAETNVWKIDFRGDTDEQDLAKIKQGYEAKSSEQASVKGTGE